MVKKTTEQLCTDINHLVCGIIFFIDETNHDTKGSNKSEPVSFTLSIFKRSVRNNYKSWRHLGFFPKINTRKPKNAKMKDIRRLKIMNYHRCLNKVLESFKVFQSKGPMKCSFFGDSNVYNIHFPLMYIIGDMKGHHVLVNHYVPNAKSHSLMKDCCIKSKHGHKIGRMCKIIKHDDIQKNSNYIDDTSIPKKRLLL